MLARTSASVAPISALEHRPFVVSGTVFGRPVSVAVASLSEVLTEIGGWTARDPEATGHWSVRNPGPAPVAVLGRPVEGTPCQRVAHVFSLTPGAAQGIHLRSCCGRVLSIVELDWLSPGDGMPCDTCLCAYAGGAAPTALAG
jgi:hypothetical protein